MNFTPDGLTGSERVRLALRSLYARHGYRPYRMSKFEEYDLYARNKDFLVSDSVITFTDRGGRLLALKPDVTLSIIKNTRDVPGRTQKLYYNENVYRVSKSTGSFRELMQVGLECVGAAGSADIAQVLWLAASSLDVLSDAFVLDVSHLGLIEAAAAVLPEDARATFFHDLSEKNAHAIAALAASCGLDTETSDALSSLAVLSGTLGECGPVLRSLAQRFGAGDALEELLSVLRVFEGSPFAEKVHVDLSVLGNQKYYNGLIFKGFVRGVPGSVLSGGQYDRLMRRFHRQDRAVGFAVYLDELERLIEDPAPEAETLTLLVPENVHPALLRDAAEGLIAEGWAVRMASPSEPTPDDGKVAEMTENGEVIFRG